MNDLNSIKIFKCFFLIIFSVVLIFSGFTDEEKDKQTADYSVNRIIVKIKNIQGAFNEVDKLNKRLNVTFLGSILGKEIEPFGNYSIERRTKRIKDKYTERSKRIHKNTTTPDMSRIYIFELPKDSNMKDICSQYMASPYVEYAQPDTIIQTHIHPDDPYYSSSGSWEQNYDDLWGLKKIQMENAWDLSLGDGVVVAVVDTGLDYTHPEMSANVWINQGEIDGDGIDNDGNGYIDDIMGWDFVGASSLDPIEDNNPLDKRGHGTHVAGIIAAVGNNNTGIIGVAPHSTIMPVKGFCDDSGSGYSSILGKCIIYAVENGADVINNSWGGGCNPRNPLLEDVIRYAYSLGAVIVFSAGNNNFDLAYTSPQNMAETITAGASTQDDEKVSYSSYGSFLDVCAPGGGITDPPPEYKPQANILSLRSTGMNLTTYNYYEKLFIGDDNLYMRNHGTSMAAPHVSGVAALLISYNPELTNLQIKEIIKRSADDIGDPGFDLQTGWGRINAYNALQFDDIEDINIKITTPANGYLIDKQLNNTIVITGTASGPDFLEYQLFYSSGWSAKEWIPIGTIHNAPVDDGVLEVWHICNLSFNLQWVKLVVRASSGSVFETYEKVMVLPAHKKITEVRRDYRYVAIEDQKIVWVDERKGIGDEDVFLYDLETDTETQITNDTARQVRTKIKDNKLAWVNWNVSPNEFYVYDLLDENAEPEHIHTIDHQIFGFAFSGGHMAWIEDRYSGNDDVFVYDIMGKQEMEITNDAPYQRSVDIDNSIVVWNHSYYDSEQEQNIYQIYMRDVLENENKLIHSCSYLYLHEMKLNGDTIIWVEQGEGSIPLESVTVGARDIYAYSISSKQKTKIVSDPGVHVQPDICDDYIVWNNIMDNNNIFLYDVNTKKIHQITEWEGYLPVVSNSAVVWRDGSNGEDSDLFTLDLRGVINIDVMSSNTTPPEHEPYNVIDGDMNTKWVCLDSGSKWIYIDFNKPKKFNRVVLQWEEAVAMSYEIQVSENAQSWNTIYSLQDGDGEKDTIYVDEQEYRYVRIHTTGECSLYEFEVFYDKITAYASSSLSSDYAPGMAIDTDMLTKWSSNDNDDEWILVDFKRPVSFDEITLEWAEDYALEYEIQTGDAGENWVTIYTDYSGAPGTKNIPLPVNTARYLRVKGITSDTANGYSLYEIKINECIKGDVLEDQNIDIIDALVVAQYYVGLITDINTWAADVNCDNIVDILDALLIAQYYVGIISEFC